MRDISKLSKAKQALLGRLLAAGGASAYPLSHGQERLWYLEQLQPGHCFYNIPIAARFTGKLDVGAAERAINQVIRRHDALRTAFVAVNGEPFQMVRSQARIDLEVVDQVVDQVVGRAQSAAAARDAEVQRFVSEEAEKPFDLSKAPLLRAKLLRLAPEEHVLVLILHHIVADGWSLGILGKEIAALYTDFVRGREPSLPPLSMQYADFSVRHRALLQGEYLETLLAYWRDHMRSSEELLPIPTDHPRPAAQAFRGVRRLFPMPASLAEAVRQASQRHGATLFMTTLAAFQLLLHRYAAGDDIVVGTPVANRSTVASEQLIGFFVNMLAMRTNCAGDPTFSELLARARRTALGAFEHQDLPFEMLVRELQPKRFLSHQPIFQVMFALQNTPLEPVQLPGVTMEPLEVDNGTAKFDLSLSIAARGDALINVWEYDSELFEDATIERMATHYQNVLRAVCADPDLRVSEVPVLGDSERDQLVFGWNQTHSELDESACAHHLFEAQVARNPDAIAVVCEGTTLSYRELDQRCNQLAHHLRRKGVSRDMRVGVCLDRSIEMLVALLGVMKAGGAYVPLDPADPTTRIAFMIRDVDARAVLTTSDLLSKLPQDAPGVICLDRDVAALAGEPRESPLSSSRPEDLAYVMYTSGSTGTPKGVMIPHLGLANMIHGVQALFHLTPEDRVLFKTAFTFDVCTTEIFWPLAFGARIVVARKDGHRDPAYLAHVIETQQITTVSFVPSMLAVFLDEGAPCASLTRILIAGEALSAELLRRLGRVSSAAIHNIYGPTEASVYATSWQCTEAWSGSSVPIGRPLANVKVHVFDPYGNPVPPGVPGELHIGGKGLARGYLNDPEETAKKFIASPIGAAGGAGTGDRLYRTGDLVRYLPDGNIEFLGRLDHQVKVRGVRIELGEIESVLAEYPAVQQAAATVASSAGGHKRLAAYVTASPDIETMSDLSADSSQLLTQWQRVWAETYGQPSEVADSSLNTVGWRSSYTGDMIPEAHMRDWLSATVERIRALRPRRILEIGCGTGMLLLRLAPECSEYVGTDFSERVVRDLEAVVAQRSIPNVRLMARTAEDFSGFDDASFDMVILNSVIQYFPSAEYLRLVLGGATRVVADGGFVFVGDVRNRALLEAFHTSLRLASCAEDTLARELRAQVQQSVREERELVVAPALFDAFAAGHPRIRRVHTEPKGGRNDNELEKYRYDVAMHVGAAPDGAITPEWQPAGDAPSTLADLRQALIDATHHAVGFRALPNPRVRRDAAAWDAIASAGGATTVGDIMAELRAAATDGLHPEDLYSLGRELGWNVKLDWQRGARDGSYSAVFYRPPPGGAAAGTRLVDFGPVTGDPGASAELTTRPLRAAALSRLVPELRAFLRDKLPSYMIPGAFMVLDELPLTANGKVDRNLLPAITTGRSARSEYVRPRTDTERLVCQLWQDLLHLEQVGIDDKFFEVGGDSLTIVRLYHKLDQEYPGRVSVAALFDRPTVRGICELLSDMREQDEPMEGIEL